MAFQPLNFRGKGKAGKALQNRVWGKIPKEQRARPFKSQDAGGTSGAGQVE